MTLMSRINEVLPWRASRFTIPLVIAALVVIALLTPGANTGERGDSRLSTFLAGPNGAKGIFDVGRRLGWSVERRTHAPFDTLNPGSIVAVLAPPLPLSERETALLLKQVRGGASLIIVDAGGSLLDSLHLASAQSFVRLPVKLAQAPRCPSNEPRSIYQRMGDQALVIPFALGTKLPPETKIFLPVGYVEATSDRFAAIGFPFGKGRIVTLSDASILRNDFVRVCKWGIGASLVQMLDYLTAGRRRSNTRIVFDEFHQGFGPQPSIMRAIRRMLFETAPGAMLLQILIASGILLLAVSPRAIPPSPKPRTQRRSQFEHVEALSSAYKQVSATRTATQRLVRGLRRRLATEQGLAGRESGDEAAFLSQVATSHPEIASETALINAALTRSSSPAELIAVGEAINTIERTIKL